MTLEQRVEELEAKVDSMKAQMEEVISAHTCAYNQITAKLDQIAVIQAERKA